MFLLGRFPSLCLEDPLLLVMSGVKQIPFNGVFIMGILALISRRCVRAFQLLQSLPFLSNPVTMGAFHCVLALVSTPEPSLHRGRTSLLASCLVSFHGPPNVVILLFCVDVFMPELCFEIQLKEHGNRFVFGVLSFRLLRQDQRSVWSEAGTRTGAGRVRHLGHNISEDTYSPASLRPCPNQDESFFFQRDKNFPGALHEAPLSSEAFQTEILDRQYMPFATHRLPLLCLGDFVWIC